MKKITAERKDIAFYMKLFYLKSHPEAYDKAKAIVCEKSIALLEDAYAKKPLPKPACETSAVDENVRLFERLGFTGAPTMILPDGRVIAGYVDSQALLNMIGN